MRKFGFVIIALLSLNSFGQVKLGLEAGTLSSILHVNSFEHDKVNVQPLSLFGFEAGFYGGYKFKQRPFYPKIKIHYRQFSSSLDYDLELENSLLEIDQKNTFTSIDLALSLARELNKWQFGLGLGVSFYEWSSAKQHWDVSFSENTEYSGSFGNEIENYEPQQLLYIDGSCAYSFFQDLSVYLNIYIPVLNSQRQMATSATLNDDSGATDLYSQINFTSYNFSVGLRYAFLK